MESKSTFSKKKALAIIIGAIVLVVIATVLLFTLSNNDKAPAPAKDKLEIVTFKSYDEIYKTIDKMGFGTRINDVIDIITGDVAKTDSIETGDGNFGATYTQVDDVDEGDVIKTNGRAIFYADSEMGVRIFSAKNGEAEEKMTISNDGEELFDIYVNDNTLITTTTNYEENATITRVYDVHNVDKIKRICQYSQSGSYRSSRLIGDDMYIISSYAITNKKDIPACKANDEKNTKLAPSEISAIALPSTSAYTVITKLNTKSRDAKATTKAILGASSDVYCNEDNMYITGTIINVDKKEKETTTRAETIDAIEKQMMIKEQTEIIKIDISDEIKFVATTKLNGRINNQYSMDEKDDRLRIAITYNDKNNNDTNKLYVLDENLNEIGSTEEFGRNESIKAVRYIKDKAYVITYKQTDPLFIIDLANDAKPAILGECRIDGFSSMLVPVNDNRLMGIGFNTKDGETMEITNGIKLVLFDISNSAEPKAIDEYVLKDYNSPVQYDARALIRNSKKDVYHIPFNHINNDKGYTSNDCGAITFGVNNDKITKPTEQKANTIKPETMCQRCTYIGDYVYMITDDGSIHSEKIKSKSTSK